MTAGKGAAAARRSVTASAPRGGKGGATVAIIVSTYNAPGFLRQVLQGYLSQTRFPDQLIVADDGSGSETAAVVADFAGRAPFPVLHVWQEDQGFRAAKVRNEAAKAASADYLVFSDGDCVPHPRFVEDHLRLAAPGWFVQGKRMLLGREVSPEFSYPGWFGLLALCLKGQASGRHHLLRIPGATVEKKGLRGIKTCNLALSRGDYFAVNGSNEDFVGWGREDAELASRLYSYGLRRKDPLFSALVFHLWHPENSRQQLADNDQMLADSVASGKFFCANGLVKDVGSPGKTEPAGKNGNTGNTGSAGSLAAPGAR